ncbi:MAG: 30S ribosomal protein S11 [Candidatus Portnoybacteria bacterium CG10_big_fil_rev_8_21_14_0_10_36_7]|uniref:Small ribosomal subunit protein uS11 n=1 Tax=Candidatus Portnoybacteria bacterium CG10_big_fil_rev_8_21_14_0_10_36_7 TaxID=1974812 RepID=A0A2M8KEH8_9BACT|nr:MAG: 30S ribosomal protein S11 [Candidatus Portnoybacteria bacterium CG10_big_fil_rev_8_21_14_0_10_36_7]
MGKKKVIAQTVEETLKEEQALTTAQKKASEKAPEKNVVGSTGQVHIKSTYNNTIISVADAQGNVIIWSSAGSLGFRGPKKATPYAATKIVETVFEKMKKNPLKRVSIFVKGIGTGRESAIRAIAAQGVEVIGIKDLTPVPHNGCRPPKVRRV